MGAADGATDRSALRGKAWAESVHSAESLFTEAHGVPPPLQRVIEDGAQEVRDLARLQSGRWLAQRPGQPS